MEVGGVGVWWLSGGRVEVGCGLGGGGVAARRRMVFCVCSFALYPLVALAMQFMTLPGLDRSCLPKQRYLCWKSSLGVVLGTFNVKCLLVDCVCPKERFVTLVCIFIEWIRMHIENDAQSQAGASFLKSRVQRLANSLDFRAYDFVVFV